ncbi:MAG TPA: hypothetical protein PKE64_18465 [Anaerolineae bacterium]|nr:hypothetical protein [Anaerolineae bacterium]
MHTKKSNQAAQLKVRTGLKAGKNCKDAFRRHLQDPYNSRKIDEFVNCCRGDRDCMR